MYVLAFLTSNKYFDKKLRSRGAGANANKYITNMVWREYGIDRSVSMVQLLADYPNRISQIPRDKVYSLTHMASDGERIPIDYNLGENEFFHSLVTALEYSVSCLCDFRILAHSLEITEADADVECRFHVRMRPNQAYFLDIRDSEYVPYTLPILGLFASNATRTPSSAISSCV